MTYDDYLLSFHKCDLKEILFDKNVMKHFSININFLVLYENQPNLGLELLNEDPDKCLSEWDSATIRAQMSLLKEVDMKCELKSNVHCRIYELPAWSYINRTFFPDNKDEGKFLQVSGTVMRSSEAKLLKYEHTYLCVKCKTPIIVTADYKRKYMIAEPKICISQEGCTGKTFIHVDDAKCKDYQEIKIQERVKEVGVGSMPNTMMVTLEDDLVDTCKPGDNVTICGIVKLRVGEFRVGAKIEIDITLKANYLQVDNISSSGAVLTPELRKMFTTFWENHSENPLIGRDTILVSFCPQLYGLYWVKLAVAVVLAGGSPLEDTTLTGIRTRAESHLLLVGDPGTGKSQLLRFASKVIPRAVLTTGVGSTSAGLTVSALKENGEWQLEAGALVMSDGGICCIDEFNSMKEHDRTSIHEAMEQQTISVAKAGIVSKFNTKCSILAACNPKGNIDPSQPLSMSIALPSSLLSRFDLVLILRDTVNQEWDALLADYILNGGYNYSKLTSSKLWSTDILQAYYAVIKKFQPKLSEYAERILSSYYQMQRRVISRNKARTTVRSLESLVRLSQGHARLMYHETVEIIDSIYAVLLVDAGMESESTILNLNLNMNDIFPEKPLSNYRELLQIILDKLSLPEILEAELARFSKYKEKLKRSRFFQKPSSENESVIFQEMRKHHSNDEGYNTVIDGANNVISQKKGNQSSTSSETFANHDKSDSIVGKAGPSHSLYACKDKSTDNRKQKVNAKKRNSDVEQNTPCVKRLKKVSSSSDAENDEGYDTVSFNNVCSRDITSKSDESGRRNEEISEKHNLNTSPIKKLNVSTKCNILQNIFVSQNDYPVQSKTDQMKREESNKKGSSPIGINTQQKVSLKNKFKVFKFNNPKPDENSTRPPKNNIRTLKKSQNPTTNNNNSVSKSKSSISIKHHQQLISNNKLVNPTSDIEKPSCSSIGSKKVNISARNSLNKTESSDSVQNDMELLKYMPGFNDDFEVDLDFDWDNFKEADCASSTMISSQNNRIINKPVAINKFNSKQSSSNNSIGSSIIARLGSGPSAQSSVGMFEADDEELDLDL